jgi:hypothetical protein
MTFSLITTLWPFLLRGSAVTSIEVTLSLQEDNYPDSESLATMSPEAKCLPDLCPPPPILSLLTIKNLWKQRPKT